MTLIKRLFPYIDTSFYRRNWIKKQLSLLPVQQTILDAGAGECQYKGLCTHLAYTSQDFNQYDGKGNNVGLQTKVWDDSQINVVSDIIAIPVENESFDNILCTEVLEHIPFPEMAIKEFSRIIKPNGKLILTAPFASFTHFAPYFFQNGFSEYWYETILKRYGFKICSIDFNGNYFLFMCQELLRFPLMIKKHSRISYFSYLFYIPLLPVLFIMDIMSRIDKTSHKFCSLGIHIVAEKVS